MLLRRLPAPLENRVRRMRALRRSKAARSAFDSAQCSPEWLTPGEFRKLLTNATEFPKDYSYDPESLAKRGEHYADTLLRHAAVQSAQPKRFLELASHDGMACYALAIRGFEATATDLDPDFDPRLAEAGVTTLLMDATNIQFDDGSIDVVFTFNAFEHFDDPPQVLKEALRVCKTGGIVFASFGPLYYSPYGLHAYREVPVPYCHLLFPESSLEALRTEIAPSSPQWPPVNGWHVAQYRELFKSKLVGDEAFELAEYRETYDLRYVGVVEQNPSCFRSKTEDFDDLIVGNISAVIRSK
jgi:SAM-dependent methyltransferase